MTRWSPFGRRPLAAACLVWFAGFAPVTAQLSQHALRFHGTGVGPPGQQDRVRIALDDNVAGAGSSPADVGAGGFTLEVWVRGNLADNATQNNGGDVETGNFNWIDGNIILDRDVWCGTERKFGVSLAGGLVRDAASGRKRIYVDGALDFESSAGVSTANLSYPDSGIPVTGNCGTGQLTPWGWYLVVAAEKHDAGAAFPSFNARPFAQLSLLGSTTVSRPLLGIASLTTCRWPDGHSISTRSALAALPKPK